MNISALKRHRRVYSDNHELRLGIIGEPILFRFNFWLRLVIYFDDNGLSSKLKLSFNLK